MKEKQPEAHSSHRRGVLSLAWLPMLLILVNTGAESLGQTATRCSEQSNAYCSLVSTTLFSWYLKSGVVCHFNSSL